MEAKIYNREGKEAGKVTLDEKIFGVRWNSDLVHQVITSMQSNARSVIAHAKGRGEVSGGGKKPWRQKGTGRARHGSSRSPIWVGGGVTHGPNKEQNYDKKINKKMKTKALYTILSRKLKDGEIIFLDDFALSAPKAREAQKSVEALAGLEGCAKLGYKNGRRAYIATPEKDDNLVKSFRNMGSVKLEEIRNINPLDALSYNYLVIIKPKESLAALSGRTK